MSTLIAQAITLLQQAQTEPTPGGRIIDRITREKPTLPVWGPAGSVITEPTFGTKLTRLTDATMGGQSWRVASNTHLASWAADGTACFVVGGGGDVRVIRFGQPTRFPYSQLEPCFSRTDPNILFTVGGGADIRTIRTYSLATDTTTTLLPLTSVLPGLTGYVGGLLSAAGTLVAFCGGAGADQHPYVVHITNTVRIKDTRNLLGGFLLHSVSVDLTGRYVLLYPAGASPNQTIVWDTQADTLTPVTVCTSGHDAVGYGTWINMDTASGPWDAAQWCKRPLSDLTHPVNLVVPFPVEQKAVNLVDHTSWSGCGPVISGTYRNPLSEPARPWRAWDDEILRIATDGSGTVERLAHHRTNILDAQNPNALDFWSEPIVSADPTGQRILFTSNMERSLGLDAQGKVRQDVFLLEAA